MSVTEIGLMGIKPHLNIMDDTTAEGQILTGVYSAVTTAAGGPLQVHWGVEIEDPSKLWAFLAWNSLEEHEQFAKSFGGEAVRDLPKILTHGEFTKHVMVSPSLPLVLKSPVTEVMLAFFPSDISSVKKGKAAARLQLFIEKSGGECDNVSYGWGVENDFPVRGEEGQTGSIFVVFIGWPSIDAHVKFRETENFKENAGLIRGMEGMIKLVEFHVSCRALGRETDIES